MTKGMRYSVPVQYTLVLFIVAAKLRLSVFKNKEPLTGMIQKLWMLSIRIMLKIPWKLSRFLMTGMCFWRIDSQQHQTQRTWYLASSPKNLQPIRLINYVGEKIYQNYTEVILKEIGGECNWQEKQQQWELGSSGTFVLKKGQNWPRKDLLVMLNG